MTSVAWLPPPRGARMLGWIFGVLFVLLGFAGTTNAVSVVERVAGLWPRPYRQGETGLFASSSS